MTGQGFLQVAFLLFLGSAIHGQTVFLSPESEFVSYPGGKAEFFCIAILPDGFEITDVEWTANGTALHETSSFGAMPLVVMQRTGNLGILALSNLTLDYNNTRIRCEVSLNTEVHVDSNSATLLLLQGRLTTVVDLTVTMFMANSSFYITWGPPFTLDIINEDPDVRGYCINVTVDNHLSLQHLLSECNINITQFTYQFSNTHNSGCNHYYFTVVAVNVVGQGTPTTRSYSDSTTTPVVVNTSYSESGMETSFFSRLDLTMSSPVCTAEISFVNSITGEQITPSFDDLTIIVNVIFWNETRLKTNQHYNMTVKAGNTEGTVNSSISISTHDVTDVEIHFVSPNTINIMTSYSDSSRAAGVLVFLVSNESSRSHLLVIDKASSRSHAINNLFPGLYQVLAYDVEQGGKLAVGIGYPAVMDHIFIEGSYEVSSTLPAFTYLESCNVDVLRSIITVQCTSNGSLATGFQAVAYLTSNSSQVHRLYVEQTTHTTATVEVEETGVYQVSIFPLREGTGILDSNVEYTQQVAVVEATTQPPTIPEDGGSVYIIIIAVGPTVATDTVATDPVPSNNTSAYIVVAVGILVVLVVATLLLAAVFYHAWKRTEMRRTRR